MLRENLINIYETSFRENYALPALTDYFKQENFTYLEMGAEIAKLHLLFDEAGIRQGDRIALIGRNNPRWCITYIATITYGAVIVPILQDFHANDVIHIINHSESRLLFLGDTFWDAIEADQIRKVEAVFSLTDLNAIYERRDPKKLTDFQKNRENHFRKAYPKGFGPEHIRFHKIPNDRMILLNYTSGTTGYSKGVMLSVNNLTGNVLFARGAINTQTGTNYFQRGGRTLSFLPLAHAYGCAFDFLAPLAVGGHITLLGKIPTPKILIEAMQVVRPTIICCVPIRESLSQTGTAAARKGADEYRYEDSAAEYRPALGNPQEDDGIVRRRGEHLHRGRCTDEYGNRSISDEYQIPDHDWIRHDRMRSAHQLHSRQRIQGRFLRAFPLGIYPGEDRLARSRTRRGRDPGARRARHDGLLQERGGNPEGPGRKGWLHTGDIATMDPDGTLYIRGRSKTMILTGSGQNIYPEEIEDKLNNMYMVQESLVLEHNGRLTALVVPDFEQAELEGIDKEELPRIMENNLKELNKLLASYEQVASITVYPTEFEKTPKRSIKRYLYNTALLEK